MLLEKKFRNKAGRNHSTVLVSLIITPCCYRTGRICFEKRTNAVTFRSASLFYSLPIIMPTTAVHSTCYNYKARQ